MVQLDEGAVTTALDLLTWLGAVVGLLSMVANAAMILVYKGMKPMKYPTYFLYINIGLADATNGLNAILTLFVYKTAYKQVLCDILGPISCTMRLTLDFLTILSVGRMTAILWPFSFRSVFSFRNTLIYIALFWVLCLTQYIFVPATGGRMQPLDYGWCAPRIHFRSNSTTVVYRMTLEMLPLVVNSIVCVACFVIAMLALRLTGTHAVNVTRDKSIKTLQCMLVSFVVCFGPWVVLELLGVCSSLGIKGIFIGPTTHPSCATKLLYKLMLTGVYCNGLLNAMFLLRGAGRLQTLKKLVTSFVTSSSKPVTSLTKSGEKQQLIQG